MRSALFGNLNGTQVPANFVLQNSKMLRVQLPHEVQGAGIAAGGLFNMTIKGTGWVAVTAHGTPVLLDTSQMPTFADGRSAVCWSAHLQVGVNRTMKAGALIGRGSGEAMQLAFRGQGFVLVQASEGPPVVQAQ